jgi:hypothetical protein
MQKVLYDTPVEIKKEPPFLVRILGQGVQGLRGAIEAV